MLNSTDGVNFFYNDADGALATQQWNAVGLASATDGAIGGDNGKLALTSAANFIPAPPAPPVVVPVTKPVPTTTTPAGHASRCRPSPSPAPATARPRRSAAAR